MDEIARAIFNADPTLASGLVPAIDEWRASQLASEQAGQFATELYDDTLSISTFHERLERIDRLQKALSDLLYPAP